MSGRKWQEALQLLRMALQRFRLTRLAQGVNRLRLVFPGRPVLVGQS